MTAYLFSKLCIEAGLPKGVLNIVHGYGSIVGQAIVEHPQITSISFTGGTVTGKRSLRLAAPMFKKLSLELGGKNPNIVFADCDFEQTITTTMLASLLLTRARSACVAHASSWREVFIKSLWTNS